MRKFLIFFAFLLLLIGCCVDSKDNEMRKESIQAMIDEVKIPLISLSYYDSGKISDFQLVYDSSDFSGKEIDKDCVFQAASLSKVVFSYIVMKMADANEIDLDAPISKYTDIDRFADKDAAGKLTPRIVMRHTTGLPNWAVGPSSEAWPTSVITFKYAPDSCFAYSGEGFAFLQRAVEAIKGKPLNEIAREEVFIPFDMPLSSYQWTDGYDEHVVTGYNRAGEPQDRREGMKANCAYTLRTTSADYLNFLVRAVLKGEGLSEKAHKEWLMPNSVAVRYADRHRDADTGFYWCLGIGSKVPAEGETPAIYWHWGDNGSYKALFVVEPDTEKAMVYLTNSAHGHEISDEICNLFFGKDFGIQDWIED